MKRVSAALAVISAVLLMGTASAKVPDTSAVSRLRQLGIMQPQGLPASPGPDAQPEVSDVADATEGLDPGVLDAVTGALEDGTPLTDDLLAGLPRVVVDILSALPFAPSPAEEVLPAPVSPPGLGPELAPEPAPAPAEQPKPAPAPKQTRKAALKPVRPAAGEIGAVFPGLPTTGHAGYASGTVVHADALEATGTAAAFSGAAFTSSAIGSTLTNEMSRIVSPALGANSSFGRGIGLELGENQVVLAKAEAKSPPTAPLVTDQIGPVNADPAAVATLVRGQAQSQATACTSDVDLAYGLGFAADLGLLALAGGEHLVETAAPVQSMSHTRLVPQAPAAPVGPIAKFGLLSETRQTIAPLTLFGGTGSATTIDFAGEFVMKATADGRTGSLVFEPGTVNGAAPVVRILDDVGSLIRQISTQEILAGLEAVIEVPGLAKITIGGKPRAIGGDDASTPAQTATYAAGAVDVVRVDFADGALADLRVGHLEAAVAVPPGGIECGIGLVKKSSRETVKPGEEFNWTVTVSNPNTCVLSKVKVVDTISVPTGIVYSIVSSDPKADLQTNSGLTWNDVGPIPAGGKKDLVINMKVAPNSGPGRFTDDAVATGVCGPAPGQADTGVGAALETRVSLNIPEVTRVLESPLRGELPRTGGLLAAMPAFALLSAGLALRRLKGRR